MDGWREGCTDRRTHGRKDGWIDGGMEGRMDGQKHEQSMYGEIDEQTDVWTNRPAAS